MLKVFRKNMNNNKGFTLIELLIVLAVLGIMAAVAVPQFTGMRTKAVVVNAKSELQAVRTAFELYFAENGQYPREATIGADGANLWTTVGEYIDTTDISTKATYNSYTEDDIADDTDTYTLVLDYADQGESATLTIDKDGINE